MGQAGRGRGSRHLLSLPISVVRVLPSGLIWGYQCDSTEAGIDTDSLTPASWSIRPHPTGQGGVRVPSGLCLRKLVESDAMNSRERRIIGKGRGDRDNVSR